jgi:cysteine-rich repeat protein
LSSGSVSDVAGPNNADNTTSSLGTGGDSDLTALISAPTNDAAVLSFNFVPSGPALTFRYVFGSEEYNEYVGQFNDVFAFFINGVNYALLPDNSTIVSINNINNGANPSFYVDNDCSDGPCPLDIEADGITVVLTLTAPVNPGVTNTIKIAIADAGDSSFDSWVMIEGGSFTLGEDCDNDVDDDGDTLVDNNDPDCQVCGDGNLDPGEQCDDGNVAADDGCSALCQNEGTECGNGIPEVGEDCDDGNTANGDCCDSLCQYESSVSPCDDLNACTDDDVCNGAGTCTSGPLLDCDDENICTQDSCDTATGCVNDSTPTSSCKEAGKSILLLKNKADDSKDKLTFKWLKGGETMIGELATPTDSTNYTLCLYAGTTSVAIAMPAGSKWKPLGTTGFKFKDKGGMPDGAQKALLKSGAAGKAKVLVKGKGGNLPDDLAPALPLPVTAQVVNDANSTCFEAVYDTDSVIKNDEKQFKAKN